MKKSYKIVSIIISITIVLGCCFGVSFAADEKLNYVLLGDSIAKGSGLTNSDDACFGRIIADTNNYNYTNYGVNGYESSDVLALLKKSNVIKSVAEADIISISVGGNNFRHANLLNLILGGIILNQEQPFNDVLDPFYDDFCKIIDIIRNNNEDALILVQTLYNPITGALNSFVQPVIDRLNECLYRYDRENPDTIHIVDVASALEGWSECFAIIHPTALGNVEIARVLLKELNQLGLGDSLEPLVLKEGHNTIEYYAACLLNPKKINIDIPFDYPVPYYI